MIISPTSFQRKIGDRVNINIDSYGNDLNKSQPAIVIRESTREEYIESIKELTGLEPNPSGHYLYFYEVSTD